MTEIKSDLQEFEKVIGVRFRNPDLLRQALTHRSFVNEVDAHVSHNERLEFLGDAIIGEIVAELLYRRFPDDPEGELTQLRSAIVRTDSLAKLGEEARIGEFILMGKGEESNGGRTRVNNLCRAFESLVGAIYLDAGRRATKKFLMPRIEALLGHILEHSLHKDARSQLQEKSQAVLRITPDYKVVDSFGPDHEKEFLVEVVIGDEVVGSGRGRSKRLAAQAAARSALENLSENGWPEEALS